MGSPPCEQDHTSPRGAPDRRPVSSGTSILPSSTSAKSSAASVASAVHVARSHVTPTSVTQLSYSRPWGHCALACSSSPSGQPLKGIGGSEGYTGGAVAGGHSVESNTAVASDGSSFQDSAKSRWYAPPYGPRQRFLGYVPTPAKKFGRCVSSLAKRLCVVQPLPVQG